MKTWETTITYLITVFREAMIALLPSMEKLKIQWWDDRQWDEWDEIAGALFKSMVVNPIEIAHNIDYELCYNIPDYEFESYTYAYFSFIAVLHKDLQVPCAFHGFSSREAPFDHVIVAVIDSNNFETKEYLAIPFEGSKFTLILHKPNDLFRVDRLEIEE